MDNKNIRNILRIVVILCLIALAACLIVKLCGQAVSDWIFIANSIVLIIAGILYKNYLQAASDDAKYGKTNNSDQQ